jgi:hypothetical protein
MAGDLSLRKIRSRYAKLLQEVFLVYFLDLPICDLYSLLLNSSVPYFVLCGI